MYKYKNQEGKEEKVQLERWVWIAVYSNGKVLKQFADDKTFHRVGEIDQDKVKKYIFQKCDGSKKIELWPADGAKLIHRYRHIVFNHGLPIERREKVYIFGLKDGNNHFINYILPNDEIVQSNDLNMKMENLGLIP